jgi:hypothetical protein
MCSCFLKGGERTCRFFRNVVFRLNQIIIVVNVTAINKSFENVWNQNTSEQSDRPVRTMFGMTLRYSKFRKRLIRLTLGSVCVFVASSKIKRKPKTR